MSARWLLAPLLVLLATSTSSAHDGPPFRILMKQKAGAYVVDVWADPDVGTGTFYVYVVPPDGASRDDVRVTVSVAPTSGRLAEVTYPAERSGRQDYHYAEVAFDEQEDWSVRIEVSGPEGGGVLTTEVEATPPGLGRWDLLCYLFPFALVAGLWIYGILRHGRRRRPAPQSEASGEQKAEPPR